MILGEISIVCRVGIPNIVDLLLELAGLNCELFYFLILVPEYQMFHSMLYFEIGKDLVYCIMMRLEITIKFEK